jgi:hypothetical protein
MNEQMKSKLHKLADQCKHPDNYHQGPWMDYIQFAELIIRECGAVIADEVKRKLGREDYQFVDGIQHGSEIIKKHFGVKE